MSPILHAVAVLTQATPSPNPTPGLREGLDESIISPGLAGFLAVFGIALVSVLLFYSLTSKLRRVRVRDGVAVPTAAQPAADASPTADAPPRDDAPPAAGASEADGAAPADGGPSAAGAAAEPDGK